MDEAIDLDELRTSFHDVLAAECDGAAVLRHHASGAPILPSLWSTAVELGWLSLAVPEAQGGLGLGLDALAILYRELGRAAAPLPILSTLLAADAMALGGAAERLGAIVSGDTVAAVVLNGISGKIEGDDVLLEGTSEPVLDGASAGLFVIRANGGKTPIWVVVEATEAVIEPIAAADRTRSLARLRFDDTRVPSSRKLELTTHALDLHAAVGIAADALGVGEAILAITIEYLKTREQFGKPIGSFQALKHRVADHHAGLVVAGAAFDDVVARAGSATLSLVDALAAKAHCTDIAGRVARDCIQLHGGIGFTSEYIAHVYLKRALLDEAMFGTIDETLDRVAWALAA